MFRVTFFCRVQVVPLSSKTDKLYPCEVMVTVEGRESKAMADQILTVSKAAHRAPGVCFPGTKCAALTWRCAFNSGSQPDAPRGKAAVSESALV
jgi:hypothetical protein